MSATRLLKYDKEGLSEAQRLREVHRASPTQKGKELTQEEISNAEDDAPLNDDPDAGLGKTARRKRSFRILLGRKCQRLLALDWDLVTQSCSLNDLSNDEKCVSSILDAFQKMER